jgi:hypothetical protein
MDYIIKLLKSKNPTLIAVGILCVLVFLTWGGLAVAAQVKGFTDQFETKIDHRQDIEQKVDSFKKDVRIAILENNAVLLEALDRKMRRASSSRSEIQSQ